MLMFKTFKVDFETIKIDGKIEQFTDVSLHFSSDEKKFSLETVPVYNGTSTTFKSATLGFKYDDKFRAVMHADGLTIVFRADADSESIRNFVSSKKKDLVELEKKKSKKSQKERNVSPDRSNSVRLTFSGKIHSAQSTSRHFSNTLGSPIVDPIECDRQVGYEQEILDESRLLSKSKPANMTMKSNRPASTDCVEQSTPPHKTVLEIFKKPAGKQPRPFSRELDNRDNPKCTEKIYSFFKKSSSYYNSFQFRDDSRLEGMRNLGNTCYMNAVLQALLGLDGFSDDLVSVFWCHIFAREGKSSNCSKILSKLIEKKRSENHGVLDLGVLKTSIDSHTDNYKGFRQQDAHEFLTDFINILHDEMMMIKPTNFASTVRFSSPPLSSPSPLLPLISIDSMKFSTETIDADRLEVRMASTLPTSRHFHAEVNVTVECMTCGYTRRKEEFFRDFSVNFPPGDHEGTSPMKLEDLLDSFFSPEERDLRWTYHACN